jgi:hypothetical protein
VLLTTLKIDDESNMAILAVKKSATNKIEQNTKLALPGKLTTR